VFGAIYAAEGSAPEAVLEAAREFSPRIDQCDPREVVLDLSGLARLFGDAKTIAEELRRTAADRGLQIRVAIAGTRTAARLMVRHRAGLTVIEPGTEAATLAALPLALLGALDDDVNSQLPTPNSQPLPTPNSQELPRSKRERLGVGSWELGIVFKRWGLRTLGDLAALPPDDVAARLGQDGVRWQHLARGEDPAPLVPSVPEERFEQSLDLEWPIEELEPLAFVLGRLLEPLEAHLERRGRGAAVLHVRLSLVKATGGTREVHERSLQLPTPIRDARTLRTLALLDLESHPPAGPIDRVVVAVDPTPGRIVQFSLITRPLPSPEQISTLMARLQALMGETRCGSPALVDSWKPGAFEMRQFAPVDSNVLHRHEPRRRGDAENINLKDLRVSASPRPVEVKDVAVALRRFRHPVPARVSVADGKPARVTIDRRGLSGGGVAGCAGPWRTSGGWWTGNGDQGSGIRDQGSGIKNTPVLDPQSPSPAPRSLAQWDRDEWDVTLTDGATYRLFRARDTERWFVDGVVD
jgi:protein ImuB